MFPSLFINLPVADLAKSLEFFTGLGVSVNPRFTNDQSACLVMNGTTSVMLSVRSRFEQLVDRPVAQPGTTEMLLSFACESPEMVREVAERAFALGARQVNEYDESEYMVSWAFEDLDGHLWDLFWMA